MTTNQEEELVLCVVYEHHNTETSDALFTKQLARRMKAGADSSIAGCVCCLSYNRRQTACGSASRDPCERHPPLHHQPPPNDSAVLIVSTSCSRYLRRPVFTSYTHTQE